MYTCPCCGYKSLPRPADGTYELCLVCWWENDQVQLRDPDYEGGANEPSLRQAQRNFIEFGTSDKDLRDQCDDPARYNRDPDWRPLI
jgi:hypothetical protein